MSNNEHTAQEVLDGVARWLDDADDMITAMTNQLSTIDPRNEGMLTMIDMIKTLVKHSTAEELATYERVY